MSDDYLGGDLFRLARRAGLDTDDERVVELLVKQRIGPLEVSELAAVNRGAIYAAATHGSLEHERTQHGRQITWRFDPARVLEWMIARDEQMSRSR